MTASLSYSGASPEEVEHGITLVLVPCLYLLIEDIHQWMGLGELQVPEPDIMPVK
ncbi:MAG: hypothetical protein QM498_08780 [Desulfobacterium sp.]